MFIAHCRSHADRKIWKVHLDVECVEYAENVCKKLKLDVVELERIKEHYVSDTDVPLVNIIN